MTLLELLDLLLILHLHVVLRLQQQLVVLFVAVQFLRELLGRLLQLLVVVEVLQAQLVLRLHRQLLHLRLELGHRLRLLLEVGLRHQDLLGERHHVLVALRAAALLVADVEDVHGAVLRRREEVRVVGGDPQPRDGAGVDLQREEERGERSGSRLCESGALWVRDASRRGPGSRSTR